MKKLLITTILLLLIGCKEEEKKKEILTFNVYFDLILKKDDKLRLYYTQDGTINFNEKNSLWYDLKGSDKIQRVKFILPEGVLPTHLRLDIGYGVNESQSDVELNSFTMEFANKKVIVEGEKIFEYFYINEANTKRIDGTTILSKLDKKQSIGPMLYPHLLLTEKSNELIRN